MISLLAALVLQQTPADDLPAAVRHEIATCLAGQQSDATQGGQGSRAGTATRTPDEADLLTEIRPGYCHISAPLWRPIGARMADAVKAGLADAGSAFEVAGWRKPFVNEYGPTVWTNFEQHDADGRLVAVVQLIEPADGARGETTISYQALVR